MLLAPCSVRIVVANSLHSRRPINIPLASSTAAVKTN